MKLQRKPMHTFGRKPNVCITNGNYCSFCDRILPKDKTISLYNKCRTTKRYGYTQL